MAEISKRLSSSQMIILGFAFVILGGSFLLMLPAATADGHGADFADALFTSVSAVCVTGLIVRDTALYWSSFGQMVILILIQIGGMGVITVAIAIFSASGREISLKQRSTMQEAISANKLGGIVRLTGFILKTTLFLELLGAAVMAPVFCKNFGFWQGLWYALFTSVSAFCNAGFDLMGKIKPCSSLTFFARSPVINLTVMALIILGGIGFMTWDDIKTNRFRFQKYRMQSKVILTVTGGLIFFPTLYFFFFEFSGVSFGERLLLSAFQSVTPRTAGFNTANLEALSETGLALIIVLMLTGGSPGSTAGGMKTTTLAVLLSTAVSVFRRREHAQFFGRRIDGETIRNAAAVLMMYLVLFLSGGLVISRLEHLPLLSCLFETASAVATVGLTLGITAELGLVSRGILIFLMYIGRVGGLTLIFAALSGNRRGNTAKLPQEKLTVG